MTRGAPCATSAGSRRPERRRRRAIISACSRTPVCGTSARGVYCVRRQGGGVPARVRTAAGGTDVRFWHARASFRDGNEKKSTNNTLARVFVVVDVTPVFFFLFSRGD